MAERRPPGFNVDLGFYDSDEVLSIPRKIRAAAIGVWTLCGSYSANKLTDGFVSAEALRDRGCTPAIRAALVASTLWEDVGEGAILFVKWSKWQRTAAEIKAWRAAEAERKRKEREAKKAAREAKKAVSEDTSEGLLQPDVDATWGLRGDHVATTWRPDEPYIASDINATSAPRNGNAPPATSGDTETSGRTSGGRPAAVRPEDGDPKTETETETELSTPVALVGGSGGKAVARRAPADGKGTRLPDGWIPTDKTIAAMRDQFPHLDLKAVHDEFCDYWRGVPGTRGRKLDWDATYRNRVREVAAKRSPPHHNGTRIPASDAAFAQAQALKNTPSRLEIE